MQILNISAPEASEKIVCTNFEELLTAVTNSDSPTRASLNFGRSRLPRVGLMSVQIDATTIAANLVGLERGMTVHPNFGLCFDSTTSLGWVEISMGSRYPIQDESTWELNAGIFFSNNFGKWYTGLNLDYENNLYSQYSASIRQIFSS